MRAILIYGVWWLVLVGGTIYTNEQYIKAELEAQTGWSTIKARRKANTWKDIMVFLGLASTGLVLMAALLAWHSIHDAPTMSHTVRIYAVAGLIIGVVASATVHPALLRWRCRSKLRANRPSSTN